jgi:hypothetical protein
MKKLIVICVSLFLTISSTAPISAAIKAGAKCPKAGKNSTLAGKKFTCVKSGNRLVWNKGVVIAKPAVVQPQPAPTPSASASAEPVEPPKPEVKKIDYSQVFSTDQGYLTEFGQPCDYDRTIEGDLKLIQDYFFQFNRCGGQLRVNKYSLGSARPTSKYSPASEFSNTQPCKLVTPPNVMSNLGYTTAQPERNEYASARKYPSPNTVIQLVPIYGLDTAEPKNSPKVDYEPYLNFVKDWIEYSSDFGSRVEVRIPDAYIKMDSKIADFNMVHTNNHNNPGHVAFNKAVVAATDPVINYSGANIAFVVPPPGTAASVMGQAAINQLKTNEGNVGVAISQYGSFASKPSSSTYTNLSHPFWWIHELFHAGYGFDDHYGDTRNDLNSEYGMGWLTMMTPWGGDLTTWEKWILGFMRESQVRCITGGTSTHWIAPSTVQTTESKAIVVAISPTKVVVVETIRPGGLYYKHPKQSHGALVYEIDIMETRHGFGMKLSLPVGRKVESNPFFMASYPLKQGESTVSNGYRFTIEESGTFGDVVKVEKI